MADIDKRKLNEVYCDNDITKRRILRSVPFNSGLYIHEIVMLIYSRMGVMRTVDTSFPGILTYQFGISYPNLMLEGLIKRGYIRVCDDLEVLQYTKSSDLKPLMDKRNLKVTGSASNKNRRIAILKEYTVSEIAKELGYLTYVPTERGLRALSEVEYNVRDLYSGWSLRIGAEAGEYITENEIDMVKIDNSVQSLYISLDRSTYNLSVSDEIGKNITTRSYDFEKGTKLNIYVDNRLKYDRIPINKLYMLRNINQIVICRHASKTTSECIGYDYKQDKELFVERAPQNLYDLPNTRPEKMHLPHIGHDGIISDGLVNYYVSLNDPRAYYILSESLDGVIKMVRLRNYIADDSSVNYRVVVSESDKYTCNIIKYMLIERILQFPVIKGVGIYDVMRFIGNVSEKKTQQAIYNNDMAPYPHEREVVLEFLELYPGTLKEQMSVLTSDFPFRLFTEEHISFYSSENPYKRSDCWVEVRRNMLKWKGEFGQLVEDLKINGVISPRWINEFTLYVLTNSYFPDAVFQYRSEWLGRQSLDIYIPSLKMGIEYHGKQHYEPVEYFGGLEGFDNTVRLDSQKIQKCKENEVKLVEWPYTRDVTPNEFDLFMKEYDIYRSIQRKGSWATYKNTLNNSYKNTLNN